MTALDALAGEQRWVAWRNELRGSDQTKVPYSSAGKKAKANDPSTWSIRVAAEARAAKVVNGQGGGIGLQLGDLGGGSHLGGIDLDVSPTTARSPLGLPRSSAPYRPTPNDRLPGAG
jgi:hypothetical protein